jgi:hypothetical protein
MLVSEFAHQKVSCMSLSVASEETFLHICAEKVQASTASEDHSIWQSQALKLKHPKTGIALSDLPYRSEAHRDNPSQSYS